MDTRGLPDLTPKQYGFVCGILAGMTGADAYREAYNTEGWLPQSIWREASRMRDHTKVVPWLDRAKEAAGEQAELTQDAHLEELNRLKGLALGGKNYGAAMRGEELRGRVAGMYVERIRNETPDPVRDAQSAFLAHADKLDPVAGKLLREAMLKGTGKAVSA